MKGADDGVTTAAPTHGWIMHKHATNTATAATRVEQETIVAKIDVCVPAPLDRMFHSNCEKYLNFYVPSMSCALMLVVLLALAIPSS